MKPKNGLARFDRFMPPSRLLWKNWAEKGMPFVFMLLLLSGCTTPNTTGGSSTPTATGSSSGLLRVTTSDGLNCPPQEFSILPNALAFATDRLSYTPVEIQQMTDYIDKAYQVFMSSEESKPIPPPPSTLRLIPANLTNNIGSWNISLENQKPGCKGKMTITNVSHETVLFQNIQVRLTEAPKMNQEHYRFLNICSLPSQEIARVRKKEPEFPICPAYPQGAHPDGEYEFSLKMAPAGTVFPGVEKVQNGDHTPSARQNLSLAPGEQYTLYLNFRTSEKGGNLKYSLIPEINVATASRREETIQVNPVTTLIYADPDQISCYAWQGNNFVPLKQDGVGMSPTDIMKNNNTWCL